MSDPVDVLVVGSGAAGLTAALTAKLSGLNVLVIEKAPVFGGTTALSGGVMWIPNNREMAKHGLTDDPDDAFRYLQHHIGNRVAPDRLKRFVRHGSEMLDFLVNNKCLEVSLFDGFPDYHAETPGGVNNGRSVEPAVITTQQLGQYEDTLRQRARAVAPGGMAGTMTELRNLAAIRTSPTTAIKGWRVIARLLSSKVTGKRYVSSGLALVTWLRQALEQLSVPLWLDSPLLELVTEHGKVTAARIQQGNEQTTVPVQRAAIIASGGFDHNRDMRATHSGDARFDDYSSGAESNTGDGIVAGQRVEAATDLMDDAWWAPTFVSAEGRPDIVIFERGKPGFVIVDGDGERFANEAQPYNELVKRMREAEQSGKTTHPSWFVMDDRYRRRYPVAGLLPGQSPAKHIDSGFMVTADSVAALAAEIQVPAEKLQATLARFNQMAASGRDEDFQRGESAFDQFSGDPTVTPNPCLAPLETPPFYAIKLYPGDLGTKGGLLTNEFAQVLREDSTTIDGLYAVGNASASAMGNFYPGAGGTIGPAMTFGYIAAKHIAGELT